MVFGCMCKAALSNAFTVLRNGGMAVYPTDTLYGLGADVFDREAVQRVFQLKHRPMNDPLPVAVHSYDAIKQVGFVDERVRRLFDVFLPGPLTLVIKRKKVVPDVVTAGLEKIAVRVPRHEMALNLLEGFGPLTATSANVHGRSPPTTIEGVRRQLSINKSIVCLDAGELRGMPSTIVDVTEEKPVLLRSGEIRMDEVKRVIGDE